MCHQFWWHFIFLQNIHVFFVIIRINKNLTFCCTLTKHFYNHRCVLFCFKLAGKAFFFSILFCVSITNLRKGYWQSNQIIPEVNFAHKYKTKTCWKRKQPNTQRKNVHLFLYPHKEKFADRAKKFSYKYVTQAEFKRFSEASKSSFFTNGAQHSVAPRSSIDFFFLPAYPSKNNQFLWNNWKFKKQ